MRVVENFKDFKLLDATCGERLEMWKDIVVIRPDPQVIWKTKKRHKLWNDAHARYIRSNKGGGSWTFYKDVPQSWFINYNKLTFKVKLTGFKHTGVFCEQAVNWDYFIDKISNANRKIKVLNLFSYTGAATLACLLAGADVCHVDASKGIVDWAKENASLSGLEHRNVRWIVDDCIKFVEREIRRENKYDAIIMDPPSYGRGPKGETFKLEENLYDIIYKVSKIVSDKPLFFVVNSYTTGISSNVIGYIINSIMGNGKLNCDEIGIKVEGSDFVLPCGNTSIWEPLTSV